jgi:hypothetical protein
MIPGTVDPGVAASPPGGDLYFASAASIASPGVPLSPEGSYNAFDTTGNAGNLRVAPLMFESPTNAGGQSVALASQAAGGGHVSEVLNFRGSPVPWIGIALLMLFGLLVLTAEFRLKGPGHSKVGGEVVL